MRLRELVEPMLAVRATYAGTPAPGVEALHGFEALPIDVGLAKFELTTGFEGRIDIVREDRRGQSVFRVVGECYRLVQATDCLNRQDRAEDLVAHYPHICSATRDDGRFVVIPARPIRYFTTADDGCPVFPGLLDRSADLVQAGLVDQRPHMKIVLGRRISIPGRFEEGFELLHQRVVHGMLDVNTL